MSPRRPSTPGLSLPARSSGSTRIMGQSSSTRTCSTTAWSTRSPSHEAAWAKERRGAVEQKDWTPVRELAGYLRLDSPGELVVLNRIRELDRVFTNLLLTQQEFVGRERVGSRVIARHAAPPPRSSVLCARGCSTRTSAACSPAPATFFVPASRNERSPGSCPAGVGWRSRRPRHRNEPSTGPSMPRPVRSS